MACVHHCQCDRGDERPRSLDGHAAAVVGQDVQPEHQPDACSESSGADIGAPDHGQLCDAMEHEPVSEGVDQVHHAEEEAHAAVGLGAPVLLLGLAEELKVLKELWLLRLPITTRLWELLLVGHLLLDPTRCALGGPRHAHAVSWRHIRALDLGALRGRRLPGRRLTCRSLAGAALLHLALGRGLSLLHVRVALRVRGVWHHEGNLEHVVGVVLLPRGEQLPRAVQLPLRGHRQPDDARPQLHGGHLRADRRVEDQPRGQCHECEADAQALEVDARDKDRRARELQARTALHEDCDAVPQAHRQDRGVDLHLLLRHRGQVGAVLTEHAHLRDGHLPASREALPTQGLVKLVVGAVVAPSEDPGVLHYSCSLHGWQALSSRRESNRSGCPSKTWRGEAQEG
mmetsp:Transcript_125707/g.367289  ORF Transcript_125707/g.367289 Transcript_125707/m.367289 type:complete len:400 (-) Transcript_125707:21-1220(-)